MKESLSKLLTSAKSNLVSAINEIHAKANAALPASGGTISNYKESYTTLTNGSINPDSSNNFVYKMTGNINFVISGPSTGGVSSFTLIVDAKTSAGTILFVNNNIKWSNEAPSTLEAGKVYIYSFISIDSGVTWYATEGGIFNAS